MGRRVFMLFVILGQFPPNMPLHLMFSWLNQCWRGALPLRETAKIAHPITQLILVLAVIALVSLFDDPSYFWWINAYLIELFIVYVVFCWVSIWRSARREPDQNYASTVKVRWGLFLMLLGVGLLSRFTDERVVETITAMFTR